MKKLIALLLFLSASLALASGPTYVGKSGASSIKQEYRSLAIVATIAAFNTSATVDQRTVIPYETDFDLGGDYNVTSSKFKAPRSGYYSVTLLTRFLLSFNWDLGEVITTAVSVGGVDRIFIQKTAHGNVNSLGAETLTASEVLFLNKGEELNGEVSTNIGGAMTVLNSTLTVTELSTRILQ